MAVFLSRSIRSRMQRTISEFCELLFLSDCIAMKDFRSFGILIFIWGSVCFINSPFTINLIGTMYLIGPSGVKDLNGVSLRKV